MAEHGILYERAFSNAPVCSVARTTLMTSVYAPRLGTQFHRKIRPVTLPKGWHLFPSYLRQAGYYTTNNSKEDYNTDEAKRCVGRILASGPVGKTAPRRKRRSFICSPIPSRTKARCTFPRKKWTRRKQRPTLTRSNWLPIIPTRRCFAIPTPAITTASDWWMISSARWSRIWKRTACWKTRSSSTSATTAACLPRSKGYLYESGLHVPLGGPRSRQVETSRHVPPGTRVNGFVNFIDFGPTLLHLAGIKVPDYMDGTPILGPDITLREPQQAG